MDEQSKYLNEKLLNETMFREIISWIGLFTSSAITMNHLLTKD